MLMLVPGPPRTTGRNKLALRTRNKKPTPHALQLQAAPRLLQSACLLAIGTLPHHTLPISSHQASYAWSPACLPACLSLSSLSISKKCDERKRNPPPLDFIPLSQSLSRQCSPSNAPALPEDCHRSCNKSFPPLPAPNLYAQAHAPLPSPPSLPPATTTYYLGVYSISGQARMPAAQTAGIQPTTCNRARSMQLPALSINKLQICPPTLHQIYSGVQGDPTCTFNSLLLSYRYSYTIQATLPHVDCFLASVTPQLQRHCPMLVT